MKYYVYKITNKMNGKWYIGKRKHHSPTDDRYMGSGRLIREAIAKYGIDCFDKSIIEVFDSDEKASKLEASLVTKESINTSMSYNMHEGGHGGFAHLNDGSIEHIERCKKGARNSSGKHHENWSTYRWSKGDPRAKAASELGLEKLRQIGTSKETREKQSLYAKQNNSMRNKCWCVPIGDIDYSNMKVFDKTGIPSGWISVKDHRASKKNKNSPGYGKYWIHNPETQKNIFHSGDTIPLGWFRGRKMEYYQRIAVDS